MTPKKSTRAPKLAMILALVLLVATTALAAAQSPDVLLPLVTGEGHTQQAVPDTPLDPDPAAPIGDSRDTNSGDFDVPAEPAAVNAFNATQWTVQNNVGIGTQTPTADIDLSRNINNYTRIWVRNPNAGGNAQTQLYLNTASSDGLVFQQFGSNYSATWNGQPLARRARLRTSPSVKGLILTTGGPYPLIMGTSDQERMRITPDGKVGIGTTTPAHHLSIAGGPTWTSNGWNGAVDLNNVSAIGWRANSSNYSFGMGHTAGGFYFFRTLSDPGTTTSPAIYDMTIDDLGDVGIGTTTPDAKLDVHGHTRISLGDLYLSYGSIYVETGNIVVDDGDIYVKGMKMTVPDYVFEPDYPLLSLDELRAYVAEEKHLPNVPDEEQIRAGGLNLGEFQMKLLEKTEELTLYTLAQDEEIERLQQTNQTQAEQLESLQQTNQAQGEQLVTMQQLIADLEARLEALEEQE